ncbi:MAG: ATP-binding protein, partial [Oscillospiraceae bacterium]
MIYLLCGKVGSGKSTYAEKLKTKTNGFVLSCDDLMLTLFDECIGPVKHQDFLARCKSFLYRQAFELNEIGKDVILDFGFWSENERIEVCKMFNDNGIETKLIYIKSSYQKITNQLEKRNKLVKQAKIK